MNQATKSISNYIAIVFDFDKTLIPHDSFDILLQDCQIDINYFNNELVKPLVADGWDKYLARAYCLVKESQQRKTNKIIKSKLINERDLIYNYQDFPTEKVRIPLSQVVYVGDGTSDIPCFTVINQYGGVAIGVYPQNRTAQEWKHRENISSSQKLSNLVSANYQEDSEMMRSLLLAIDCISAKIALRKLSAGN